MSVPTVDRMKLTAVFETDEEGWINARVVELPGASTCARTLEEARDLLADAVRELVASYVEGEEPSGASYETLEVVLS